MRLIAAFGLFFLWTIPGWPASTQKAAVENKPSGALQPPPGFVQVEVLGVIQAEGSRAVVLRDAQGGILLPIWIGEAEAFSIQLRLERRRFERPLTHDLVDRILRELGGELVKIQIDDLRNNTFMASITIRQGKRTFSLDARPSDSIALAVGNQAPIFVARSVLEQAGIKQQELDQSPEPFRKPEPAPEPAEHSI